MPIADLGGLSVNWSERPGTGPSLMLLHCSLASNAAWDQVIGHLPPNAHIVAPDLAGHGATGYDPERGVGTQTLAGFGALLSQMPAPVHLVGHSFGAVMALGLSIQAPDRIASVTVYEPVLFGLLADANHPEWTEERARREVFATCWGKGPEVALRHFLDRWGGGMPLDHLPTETRAQLLRDIHMIPLADRDLYGPAEARISAADLSRISAPVTVVTGGRSEPLLPILAEIIVAHCPNARSVTLSGATHMGPISHPKDMADIIAQNL